MRYAVGIQGQFGVPWEALIHRVGGLRELGLDEGHKVIARLRHPEPGAIVSHARLTVRPGKELVTVVGESLGTDDIQIPSLQGVGEMDEDADFKGAAIDGTAVLVRLSDKAPPSLRSKAEVDFSGDLVTTGMTVLDHQPQRVKQAPVLRGRTDGHLIEQPEQQGSGLGVNGPEQRQLVVTMPGGNRLALLCQFLDTPLPREKGPDLVSEEIIRRFAPRGDQHLPENGDQRLLHCTVLIAQCREFLLGSRLRAPDAEQKHLDQLVAAARSRLTDQGQQQGVPLAFLHVEKLADLEHGGFGGELADLGVGHALQRRIGVDQAGQPGKPFRPEPDRRWPRRSGGLLQPAERRGWGV